VFGLAIDRVIISKEPWLSVPADSAHPLLSRIKRLVFDNEVGCISINNNSAKSLVFIDKDSRF